MARVIIGPSVSKPATALLFGGAAAGVVALHLTTNGTLGFHIDELYHIDCGLHPALGYVDFPPVVPLLANLETDLLGISPCSSTPTGLTLARARTQRCSPCFCASSTGHGHSRPTTSWRRNPLLPLTCSSTPIQRSSKSAARSCAR
jgi:hypothetical protein